MQKKQAEANYQAAKSTADSLFADIAKEIGDLEGIRPEATRKILNKANKINDRFHPEDLKLKLSAVQNSLTEHEQALNLHPTLGAIFSQVCAERLVYYHCLRGLVRVLPLME